MENTQPARAWVDEQDAVEEKELPAFLRQSAALPSWAVSDATLEARAGANDDDDHLPGEAAARKRFRSEGLATLLSQTAPLLDSKTRGNRAAGAAVVSTLPLPRDAARTIQWHPNGQLVIVGGNHHVYTFHAAGRYVERLSKVDIGARMETSCLTSSGEELLLAGHDATMPSMLAVATERLTPLRFLDARGTAPYRTPRRDQSKRDFAITRIAERAGVVAVASGPLVRLASLRSAGVLARLALDDPVNDLAFPGPERLAIATGSELRLYDLRHTARFLEAFRDPAVRGITRVGWGPHALAIGSTSGVVSLYDGEPASPKGVSPIKTFKNLTTAIDAVAFGRDRAGEVVLAFSTRAQKAGFRLARLPSCGVIPSFPAATMRHGFVQSLAFAPTLPILSVGERQKVTNYSI
ncbi:unnamed protein product [Phytomonas sp. EM1]|nr:unnamed protein product [Phytomonas sp. EM1]|eukprot:CCW63878.1 unnamed protein product [Phytomonas sp. isolate EM1]